MQTIYQLTVIFSVVDHRCNLCLIEVVLALRVPVSNQCVVIIVVGCAHCSNVLGVAMHRNEPVPRKNCPSNLEGDYYLAMQKILQLFGSY